MSNRKRLLSLIILVVLIGIGITIVIVISHMLKTDPSKAMRVHGKMPVRLAKAKVETIKDIIGASGQTQEFEKVTLIDRISQPATSVKFNLGDKVERGQILIEFEKKVIKAIVDEAKESLNKTKTNLEYSKLNYNRLLTLYNQNLIAKAELEKAEEQVKEAQWKYSSAIRQLEKALQDLNYTTVRSPVKGIVLERLINPGETPKLDTPIITLGIIDSIFMTAKVAEDKISYVHLKQPAEILFSSFPNEVFKGEIAKIDPNTDPKTRTFTAYMKIPNTNLKLTPGLTGFARIENYKRSLAVPSISVINPVGETATVFIVDSNFIVHIKRVKKGVSADGLTEIIEGLKEGDSVITAGIEFIKDSDKVRIMEDK